MYLYSILFSKILVRCGKNCVQKRKVFYVIAFEKIAFGKNMSVIVTKYIHFSLILSKMT